MTSSFTFGLHLEGEGRGSPETEGFGVETAPLACSSPGSLVKPPW